MDKQVTKQENKNGLQHRLIMHDDLSLPKDTSLASLKSFSNWIRALLQNWRQGTVGVKDRSEVARSNKKPWKQKGTGRARAGSARSPLWRGGGVVFGPSPRVARKKLPKNVKNKVLSSLLVDAVNNGNISCVTWQFTDEKPKTTRIISLLKEMNLTDKKVLFFISPNDHLIAASCANIPNVQVVAYDQPNAYSLALGKHWIIFDKDLDTFKEVVSRWI
jgi:large subunit ribosomal protein L4